MYQNNSLISKNEKHLILFITLLAATLRLWGYSYSTVEHFDEGVYASNFWFGEEDGFRYPDRHLYAPPLLPSMIEWSHVFIGNSPLASLLPGLFLGIATVPLIWFMNRQISSPVAGLAAAALLATNDSHILYSRTALTEPLLCFWMLLSVCLAHQSLTHLFNQEKLTAKVITFAVFSGLAAGLAWLSKYNGWLALAVIISASIAWGLFGKFTIRKWGNLLIILAIIVTAAFLIWLPYLSSLQKFGGYAAVAGNHQQYFVGLSGWTDSFYSQLSKQFQLIGITTICGFCMVAVLIWNGARWNNQTPQNKQSRSFSLTSISLGTWLVASWLIGLSVAIPLYYPYPRLCVPWIVAFHLAVGLGTQKLCYLMAAKSEHKTEPRSSSQLLLIFVLGAISFIGPIRSSFAWFPRMGLQRAARLSVLAADRVAEKEGHQPGEVIFYVYGEPALYYHLSAHDRLVGPIGHLNFAKPGESAHLPYPIFLAIGPHALKSELFHQQWKEQGDQFKLIEEYQYSPSLLVQLNEKQTDIKNKKDGVVKLYQLIK